jgi:hypothetical protein
LTEDFKIDKTKMMALPQEMLGGMSKMEREELFRVKPKVEKVESDDLPTGVEGDDSEAPIEWETGLNEIKKEK